MKIVKERLQLVTPSLENYGVVIDVRHLNCELSDLFVLLRQNKQLGSQKDNTHLKALP